MTLDSSVMNVSIATVAKDLGTTVTGIQTAITMYTLVMASLMITGGKVGQMIGRKRAFAIGCIVYACGSLTTALSQNLTTLMIGWSGLEGLAAVLVVFVWWENRRVKRGEGALVDPSMLRNLQLRSGVMSFLFMFLIQAGIFFTVPLFLSVALGISAVETGVRLLPLSLTLLLF